MSSSSEKKGRPSLVQAVTELYTSGKVEEVSHEQGEQVNPMAPKDEGELDKSAVQNINTTKDGTKVQDEPVASGAGDTVDKDRATKIGRNQCVNDDGDSSTNKEDAVVLPSPPSCPPPSRLTKKQMQYFTLLVMFHVQVLFALMNDGTGKEEAIPSVKASQLKGAQEESSQTMRACLTSWYTYNFYVAVLSKPMFKHVPPFGVALWRMVLSLPLLFYAAYREGNLSKFHRRDVPDLVVLGLLGVAVAQSTVFLANQIAGPQIVSIMQPTGPVYAALFAALLKLEKMTWCKAGGILLSIIGALVILRPDTMSFGTGTGTGVIVMLTNAMSYALFLVLLKRKMATHPYPIALTAHATFWGFFFMAVVGLPSGLAAFDIAATPASAWGVILYCAFGISFWASLWQTWAVKQTSATLPALFSSLSPFLTRVLTLWLLNDRTVGAFTQFIGLSLNLLGLFLVIYSRAQYEQPVVVAVKQVEPPEQDPSKPPKIFALPPTGEASSGIVTPQISWLEDLQDTSISPRHKPSKDFSEDLDRSSSTAVLH